MVSTIKLNAMQTCGNVNNFQMLTLPANVVPSHEENAEMRLTNVGRVFILSTLYLGASDCIAILDRQLDFAESRRQRIGP